MPWMQILMETAAHEAEELAELMSQSGAISVTLEDAAEQPLYEPLPGETRLWKLTRVNGLFEAGTDPATILAAMRSSRGTQDLPPYTVHILEDQDWERAWMDRFKPMRFGQRLWICPSWASPPDSRAVNIMLDPGLAFGTGTHPTTALCLTWLDAQALDGNIVVDYGCGSGILAIAAARLGARRVWAIDHDPQALTATRLNAQVNGVAERIRTLVPGESPTETADVLLANILALPIMALAPRFAELVRPGARIALSGILKEQSEEVLKIYQTWFNMDQAVEREGWVLLTGVRKSEPGSRSGDRALTV